MTVIQAYRREKTYRIFIDSLKTLLVFTPNARGHVVCEVENERAVDWLLQTPTGFRVYDPEPEAETFQGKPDDKYVLVSGDSRLDLNELKDKELREFCKANRIEFDPSDKGDTLRDKIVAVLKVGG